MSSANFLIEEDIHTITRNKGAEGDAGKGSERGYGGILWRSSCETRQNPVVLLDISMKSYGLNVTEKYFDQRARPLPTKICRNYDKISKSPTA